MEDYDLGIITKLAGGYAYGKITGSDDDFKIKVIPEAMQSVEKYQVVAINLNHDDFIYAK